MPANAAAIVARPQHMLTTPFATSIYEDAPLDLRAAGAAANASSPAAAAAANAAQVIPFSSNITQATLEITLDLTTARAQAFLERTAAAAALAASTTGAAAAAAAAAASSSASPAVNAKGGANKGNSNANNSKGKAAGAKDVVPSPYQTPADVARRLVGTRVSLVMRTAAMVPAAADKKKKGSAKKRSRSGALEHQPREPLTLVSFCVRPDDVEHVLATAVEDEAAAAQKIIDASSAADNKKKNSKKKNDKDAVMGPAGKPASDDATAFPAAAFPAVVTMRAPVHMSVAERGPHQKSGNANLPPPPPPVGASTLIDAIDLTFPLATSEVQMAALAASGGARLPTGLSVEALRALCDVRVTLSGVQNTYLTAPQFQALRRIAAATAPSAPSSE